MLLPTHGSFEVPLGPACVFQFLRKCVFDKEGAGSSAEQDRKPALLGTGVDRWCAEPFLSGWREKPQGLLPGKTH